MKANHERLRELLDHFSRQTYIRPDRIPDLDLYMDQVTTFMDEHLRLSKRYPEDKILTKTMINNYAKNNLLPPPLRKKYSKNHILFLIFIYYFKNVLTFRDIEELFNPIADRYFSAKPGDATAATGAAPGATGASATVHSGRNAAAPSPGSATAPGPAVGDGAAAAQALAGATSVPTPPVGFTMAPAPGSATAPGPAIGDGAAAAQALAGATSVPAPPGGFTMAPAPGSATAPGTTIGDGAAAAQALAGATSVPAPPGGFTMAPAPGSATAPGTTVADGAAAAQALVGASVPDFTVDTLTGLYERLYAMEISQSGSLMEDFRAKFEAARSFFPDDEDPDGAYLQLFAFICSLSFDVYLKKQAVEFLIDQFREESAQAAPGPRARTAKKK